MSYIGGKATRGLHLGTKGSGMCPGMGQTLRDPTGAQRAKSVQQAAEGKATQSVAQFDSKAYAPMHASLATMDRPLGIPYRKETFNPKGAGEKGKSEFEK